MSNQLQIIDRSAFGLLMQNESMDKLERLADLMASGRATMPKHLVGSKGDCFAIALQSMQWGMNPIAVAQKTHLINGTPSYEAQLVSAVINSSGVVADRFNFEWFGDWDKIVGRFKEVESKTKKDDNGYPKKYIVPDWQQSDERGLGVKVWATLKGESQPRVLTLLLAQARTRNSTLWTEDPKQQLAYLAQKRWARLYAPDVILGVYTPDELQPTSERFMGEAEILSQTGAAGEAAHEVVEQKPEKTYPQADFDKNLPTWVKYIVSGKKTAKEILTTISAKAKPTPEQEAALQAAVDEAQSNVVDAEIKPVTPSAEQIAQAMQQAQNTDQLYAAALHIDNLPEDQRQALNEIFDARNSELKGQ